MVQRGIFKLMRSVFFYGLAAYVGWYGVQYASNTPAKFSETPYMMIANIEPFAGEEEPACHAEPAENF